MQTPSGLRETMVAHLERTGILRQPNVAAAMRSVPRHHFLPEVPVEDAYADRAIAIKSHGSEVVSSISQPGMIVQMLELLGASAGDRVLEIGTGSGYNAALLAELVGPSGSVTSVDLDPELALTAAHRLQSLDYANVTVLAADGANPCSGAPPYDRLIVTARADDVASAWWDAVRDGARLVVPLRLERAGEYAVGFVRGERRLASVGVHPCAFVPIRGEAADATSSELFYRDPTQTLGTACVRRVASVVAVRREDATTALLDEADLVIARPVSLFGVSFIS